MSELPRAAAHHPARVVGAVVASVVSGALVATQTRINGELGARLHDGFVAAAISFGSGLVILAVGLLVWPRGRRGLVRVVAAVRARRMPWWHLLGGTAGALFVLGQGLLGALLGVALFTVGIVAGQTISSLLIDRRGFGALPARPVTPQRLIGALLAVAAVLVAGSEHLVGDIPLWAVAVPVLIGLPLGAQPALNAEVRREASSAYTSTFVNFVVGGVLLIVVALVQVSVAGWPVRYPPEPWLYVGGLVGMLFIAAQTVLVRVLGVLLMGLAVLAGQLGAAVLLDLVAPLPGDRLVVVTVVGAVVTLIAVVVAAIPSRRPSAGRQSVSR